MSRDIRLAARIFSELCGGPPARVTPVVGRGTVNKVFVVEAAGRKVVVRMSARGGASEEYAKEAWCMAEAAARGVLVPSVLGRGRCEDHAYAVQSYVDGEEARESTAPKAHVWRRLGEYARLTHSVGVPGFGLDLSEMTRGDGRAAWLRHVDYNVESLSADDPLLGLRVIDRRQSEAIKRVFAGLRARAFTFGLNHGDISLKNAVVGEAGDVYLLDWGSAEAAAVPHHDLIEMLKMNMEEGAPSGAELLAFLDGYGLSAAALEEMTPDLLGLLTLRAFDKLRWALDRRVEGLGRYVKHAREAADRCLNGGRTLERLLGDAP